MNWRGFLSVCLCLVEQLARAYFRVSKSLQASYLPNKPSHLTQSITLTQLRSRTNAANGSSEFFFADPRRPYGDASIVSSQPALLRDYTSGLNTTAFTCAGVVGVVAWLLFVHPRLSILIA